jgi:hypothetical protein
MKLNIQSTRATLRGYVFRSAAEADLPDFRGPESIRACVHTGHRRQMLQGDTCGAGDRYYANRTPIMGFWRLTLCESMIFAMS